MENLFPPHKAGLSLWHNEHVTEYKSFDQWWDEMESFGFDETDWVSPEQFRLAKETGDVWELRWYPNSPVGSCCVFGHDLEAVLKHAKET